LTYIYPAHNTTSYLAFLVGCLKGYNCTIESTYTEDKDKEKAVRGGVCSRVIPLFYPQVSKYSFSTAALLRYVRLIRQLRICYYLILLVASRDPNFLHPTVGPLLNRSFSGNLKYFMFLERVSDESY
jgi:hypothetical protein